ncbi:MAG: hypothetical protein Q8R90_02555, partial [Bacteroidales bacterium]|nr:hypothetical protein [Bacteroidales bacterium]
SKVCGIIDTADYSKVAFLWEQRCLFAHPYNLKPEVDEVKHILGQAARITLCKELQFNKTYLTDLAENISSKPFFLPTEIEQVRNYAKRTISRTPLNLHPFLFKTLLFKVGQLSQSEEKFSELRKLRYFLVELLINTTLPLDNADWSLENRVTNFPYECFIGFVHKDTWTLLPDRIKEMLIAYLEGETDNTKLIALKAIAGYIVQNNSLEEGFKNRYHKKLNGLSFDTSIYYYGSNKAIFKRICDDLESNQYEQQNPVIDFLRKDRAIELINGLDKSKQIYLGRLLKSAAKNNHWKSQNLVTSITSGSILYSDWLKAGIALGGFMSLKDELEIDNNSMEKSAKILNVLPEPIQNEIYDIVELKITEGKISCWDKMMFSEPQFIASLKKIDESISEWNGNNKLRFDTVTENIRIALTTEEAK